MSKKLIALQEKQEKLSNEARGILAQMQSDDTLSEENETRYQEINTEMKKVTTAIDRIKQQRNWDAAVAGAPKPEPTQNDKNQAAMHEPLGLLPKEVRMYSMMRAMQASMEHKLGEGNGWKGAPFELEIQNEMKKRSEKIGREVRGVMLPPDLLISEKRDLLAGAANSGAETVATDLSQNFIDLLRSKLVLERAGATFISGLVGNVDFPKMTGGATGHWVNEGAAIPKSDQTTGMVSARPRQAGAYTEYTRRMIKQSSIDMEMWVRNDLAQTLARLIQTAAITGAGGMGPTGIENITGVGTSSVATAGQPTWEEAVAMVTALKNLNADRGRMGYLVNPTHEGHMKVTEAFASTGRTIWSEAGTVNSYAAHVSTLVSNIIFGNFEDLMLLFWGGLDIVVDPLSKADQGRVRIVAIQDCDVQVRHPESFVKETTP